MLTLFLGDLILTHAMKGIKKHLKRFYSLYKKDPEAAIDFLRSLAPENPMLHTVIGLLLFKRQALVEAELEFRKALANDRFDFVAAYFLGYTLEVSKKDIEEAFSLYEIAYYIFPWDPDIKESYFKLKHALQRRNKAEESEGNEEIVIPPTATPEEGLPKSAQDALKEFLSKLSEKHIDNLNVPKPPEDNI